MKSLNIVRIAQMWPRDRKWANTVEKMALTDFLNAKLQHTFNLWKMQYLPSTLKWGIIFKFFNTWFQEIY